jgi:hypothetical protein
MRAVKAKRIRKAIYGDDSIRDRKYGAVGHRIKRMVTVKGKDGRETREMRAFIANEIRCLGKRAEYQQAKRAAK